MWFVSLFVCLFACLFVFVFVCLVVSLIVCVCICMPFWLKSLWLELAARNSCVCVCVSLVSFCMASNDVLFWLAATTMTASP